MILRALVTSKILVQKATLINGGSTVIFNCSLRRAMENRPQYSWLNKCKMMLRLQQNLPQHKHVIYFPRYRGWITAIIVSCVSSRHQYHWEIHSVNKLYPILVMCHLCPSNFSDNMLSFLTEPTLHVLYTHNFHLLHLVLLSWESLSYTRHTT